MILSQTIEALARTGVNLEFDASSYVPTTAEKILRIVISNGAHLTIRNASEYLPTTLDALARIGGKHLTLSFGPELPGITSSG